MLFLFGLLCRMFMGILGYSSSDFFYRSGFSFFHRISVVTFAGYVRIFFEHLLNLKFSGIEKNLLHLFDTNFSTSNIRVFLLPVFRNFSAYFFLILFFSIFVAFGRLLFFIEKVEKHYRIVDEYFSFEKASKIVGYVFLFCVFFLAVLVRLCELIITINIHRRVSFKRGEFEMLKYFFYYLSFVALKILGVIGLVAYIFLFLFIVYLICVCVFVIVAKIIRTFEFLKSSSIHMYDFVFKSVLNSFVIVLGIFSIFSVVALLISWWYGMFNMSFSRPNCDNIVPVKIVKSDLWWLTYLSNSIFSYKKWLFLKRKGDDKFYGFYLNHPRRTWKYLKEDRCSGPRLPNSYDFFNELALKKVREGKRWVIKKVWVTKKAVLYTGIEEEWYKGWGWWFKHWDYRVLEILNFSVLGVFISNFGINWFYFGVFLFFLFFFLQLVFFFSKLTRRRFSLSFIEWGIILWIRSCYAFFLGVVVWLVGYCFSKVLRLKVFCLFSNHCATSFMYFFNSFREYLYILEIFFSSFGIKIRDLSIYFSFYEGYRFFSITLHNSIVYYVSFFMGSLKFMFTICVFFFYILGKYWYVFVFFFFLWVIYKLCLKIWKSRNYTGFFSEDFDFLFFGAYYFTIKEFLFFYAWFFVFVIHRYYAVLWSGILFLEFCSFVLFNVFVFFSSIFLFLQSIFVSLMVHLFFNMKKIGSLALLARFYDVGGYFLGGSLIFRFWVFLFVFRFFFYGVGLVIIYIRLIYRYVNHGEVERLAKLRRGESGSVRVFLKELEAGSIYGFIINRRCFWVLQIIRYVGVFIFASIMFLGVFFLKLYYPVWFILFNKVFYRKPIFFILIFIFLVIWLCWVFFRTLVIIYIENNEFDYQIYSDLLLLEGRYLVCFFQEFFLWCFLIRTEFFAHFKWLQRIWYIVFYVIIMFFSFQIGSFAVSRLIS